MRQQARIATFYLLTLMTMAAPALGEVLNEATGVVVRTEAAFGGQCRSEKIGVASDNGKTFRCVAGYWRREDLLECPTSPPTGRCDFNAFCLSKIENDFYFCDANKNWASLFGSGGSGASATPSYLVTAATPDLPNERVITPGAGIAGTDSGAGGPYTLATASNEAGFLAAGALTCGAGTAGKSQVHTTPLQYCDNAATPTLRYCAYGTAAGTATCAAGLDFDCDGTYEVRSDGTSVTFDTDEDGVVEETHTGFNIDGSLNYNNRITFNDGITTANGTSSFFNGDWSVRANQAGFFLTSTGNFYFRTSGSSLKLWRSTSGAFSWDIGEPTRRIFTNSYGDFGLVNSSISLTPPASFPAATGGTGWLSVAALGPVDYSLYYTNAAGTNLPMTYGDLVIADVLDRDADGSPELTADGTSKLLIDANSDGTAEASVARNTNAKSTLKYAAVDGGTGNWEVTVGTNSSGLESDPFDYAATMVTEVDSASLGTGVASFYCKDGGGTGGAVTCQLGQSGRRWATIYGTTLNITGTYVVPNGGLIDLSQVDDNATTEGIRLPQAADVSAAVAEGQVGWDTDDNQLYIGPGGGTAQTHVGGDEWRIVKFFNECLGDSADPALLIEGSTTGITGDDADAATTSSTIGACQSDTGASSGNEATFGLGRSADTTTQQFEPRKLATFGMRLKIVTPATSTNIVGGVRMGTDGNYESKTDGIYFLCAVDRDSDNDGTAGDGNADGDCLDAGEDADECFWRAITMNNAADSATGKVAAATNTTFTNTGVACNGAIYQNLRIEYARGAVSAKFYINDSLVATHTTNVPAAARRLFNWGETHETRAAAARSIAIDYIYYRGLR